MQEVAEYFEWHRVNSHILRIWFKQQPIDDTCVYQYIINVLTNNGALIGLMLNDEPEVDGAEFYRLEDLRNWSYYEHDQTEE
jgi:hypothetical protein